MSWSGFKKAVNRAGAHVIMKTSKHAEVSVDPEFDRREEKFKKFNGLTAELDTDMSLFLKNFEDLMEAQLNLVKTIDSYYGDYNFQLKSDYRGLDTENGPKINERDGISLEYLKILDEIKDTVLPELLEPLKVTVADPITDLLSYNEEISRLIQKRGRKKFDYDVLKTKLDKLQKEADALNYSIETIGSVDKKPQLSKQLKRLEGVKNDFEQARFVYTDLNGRLKNEIDQYLTLRFSLLDPTFESFVKIQMKLYGDLYDKLTSSSLSIDGMSLEEQNENKLDDRLDEILGKMKNLRLINTAK
ncbi:hypothetical protein HII13_002339 [Brettanomyces bruxellensis]|uniref:DEBR0S3_07470g1_1 n=1 Tax=Dekkera bruxellensis TaxID=5007 RepID=A0A7D9CXT6_DEKBR|nr:hypothetical protein HII13_002339 [Brettanomyces bruxellensis]VUG18315.1 hob3 [Brettanomyces bruxellensis]